MKNTNNFEQSAIKTNFVSNPRGTRPYRSTFGREPRGTPELERNAGGSEFKKVKEHDLPVWDDDAIYEKN